MMSSFMNMMINVLKQLFIKYFNAENIKQYLIKYSINTLMLDNWSC